MQPGLEAGLQMEKSRISHELAVNKSAKTPLVPRDQSTFTEHCVANSQLVFRAFEINCRLWLLTAVAK